MAVAQPLILYVWNDADTGKVVNNYGTGVDGAVRPDAGCVENTDFQYAAFTGFDGCWESLDPGGADQAWINTSLTGLSTSGAVFLGIGIAICFNLDSPHGDGFLVGSSNANDFEKDIAIRLGAPGTSGYKLTIRCLDAFDTSIAYDNLVFGTTYRLAVSFTMGASGVLKAKLDGGSVQSASAVDTTSTTFQSTSGFIGRGGGFTNHYGIDGRIPYFAYQRGVVWSETDLADINTDPSSAITGWPGVASSAVYVVPNAQRIYRKSGRY